jgi:biopolymer transport protein TolR
MPAVVARSGRRRRAMAEMNMVPFIDVMLVLLIIFMVSAPLIATGLVELPSVGKTAQRPPDRVVEVIVGSDEKLKLRVDRKEPQTTTLDQLAERVRQAQGGDAQTPVVISADKNVKYDAVVKAMDRLQKAGIQRVGLVVKQGGG